MVPRPGVQRKELMRSDDLITYGLLAVGAYLVYQWYQGQQTITAPPATGATPSATGATTATPAPSTHGLFGLR